MRERKQSIARKMVLIMAIVGIITVVMCVMNAMALTAINGYIRQMEENVAHVLGISTEQVNIKATTEEHLGFTGREEGIASQAVCLLESFYESSVPVADSESRCTSCPGCTAH